MSDNPEIKNKPESSEDMSPVSDDLELMIQRKKAAAAKRAPEKASPEAVRPSPASQRRAVPGAAQAPAASPSPSPASQRRAAQPPQPSDAATQKRAVPQTSAPRPDGKMQNSPKVSPARRPTPVPAVSATDDDDELIPLKKSRKPAAKRSAEPAPQKTAEKAASGDAPRNPSSGSSAPYAARRSTPAVPGTVSTKKTQLEALPKKLEAAKKKDAMLISEGKKKDSDGKGKKKITSAQNGADMMASIVKAIIYMVVVVVIAVFISIFVIKIGNDVFAFVKNDIAVDVTIPEDATVEDIADILYNDGIIKYPSIFKLYASLKKDEDGFIAGEYTVSPAMSYDELRYAFKEHIATGTSWITIPEGYSTDEIIDLMVSNGIGEREKYIDVINNYDFDFWFMEDLKTVGRNDGRSYRLEGYLFPDTYEFYNASSEEMVIKKLLKRFDEVFVTDYKTKAAELGYSVDEILTIASMIEKEAGNASDYMYVSSVFHNRLRDWEVPFLGSDASIVYAIQIGTGVRPSTITHDDLSYDSPYNTYTHEGLPPGPITNPSASAIRYALYPAATENYYFITADNGVAYYAKTKEEHAENIEYVNRINEKLASG